MCATKNVNKGRLWGERAGGSWKKKNVREKGPGLTEFYESGEKKKKKNRKRKQTTETGKKKTNYGIYQILGKKKSKGHKRGPSKRNEGDPG